MGNVKKKFSLEPQLGSLQRWHQETFFKHYNPNITVKDLWNGNKRWDVNKIKEILSDQNDVEDICKIYILVNNDNDKMVWPL